MFITKEQQELARVLPFMQAYADGKTIQFNEKGSDKWITYGDTNPVPLFDDYQKFNYRIKPSPKRVPLTADDIPAVCWVSGCISDNANNGRLVISVNDGDVTIYKRASQKIDSVSYQALMEQFYYSTDRKTWKPCWKEIEE